MTCPVLRKSSGHYLCQIIGKVNQQWDSVKLKSVQTLLKITYLVLRKSYQVKICLNSCAKVDQNKNWVKLKSVQALFKITYLLCLNTMERTSTISVIPCVWSGPTNHIFLVLLVPFFQWSLLTVTDLGASITSDFLRIMYHADQIVHATSSSLFSVLGGRRSPALVCWASDHVGMKYVLAIRHNQSFSRI